MKKYWLLLLCLLPFWVEGQVITTFAGGGTGAAGSGDGGPATAASIGYLAGMAVDTLGNVLIADGNNNRVRKIDIATGIINTVAGNGTAGYGGDGGQATAARVMPYWLAIDKQNNLFISDSGARIRKVDALTGVISTIAGGHGYGFAGDGGPASAALFGGLQDIAFDTAGSLYIVDAGNRRIRRIDTSRTIVTIGGTGAYGNSGDGSYASSASIDGVVGICTDGAGNIYMAVYYSHIVRKITISTGIISTIAGTGTVGFFGDGMRADTAMLYGPFGVASNGGCLYIADHFNQRIRFIDTSGIIHTVVGIGTAGFSGDGGSASSAQLNRPQNLTFNKCGDFYIADYNNRRIRKVTNPSPLHTDTPVIYIVGSTTDTICAGSSVVYTATFTHGGSFASYQWFVNAMPVSGATGGAYTYTPGNGDSVQCRITTWNRCSSNSYGVSNTIHMVVNPVVTPIISIAPSPNDTVCAGMGVTYVSTVSSGGSSPSYQWVVNGGYVGTGGTSFTYTPASGDSVYCILSVACATSPHLASNVVHMVVYDAELPAITIAASPGDTVCDATYVLFTSATSSGGSAPGFQWKVNGVNVGSSASAYSYTPANGDSVRCLLTSSDLCASPATVSSNTINMLVETPVHPCITVSGPTVAPIGTSVTITATVTGAGTGYVIHWFNFGVEFSATTVPAVTYNKVMAEDSITAKVVSNDLCFDSTFSGYQLVWSDKTASPPGPLSTSGEEVTCYPNPVHTELVVAAGVSMRSVVVVNLMGQVVYSGGGNGAFERVVDVRGLAVGVYFVRVVFEDGSVGVERFVKIN